MHIVVLFINIGHYHYARLVAASRGCALHGWRITAIEVTDNTLRHPWGRRSVDPDVPIITINKSNAHYVTVDGGVPRVDVRDVDECLDELHPDVVFVPGWAFDICRQFLRWCRRHGVPVVLMSESKFDDEHRYPAKEWLKRWLYVRHFAAALVGGAAHRDYLVSLGMAASRIVSGYDAVDNDYFEIHANQVRQSPANARRKYPQIPQRQYFIGVSRIVPRKNFIGLVRAYAEYVRSSKESWDLVVCGDGPQLPVVRGEVERLGVGQRVHFPGFVSYTDLPAWYGLSGAFVHPALKEQWGLVVNEACAAGLPVVVSRSVGARYDLVIEGGNGFLFDPADTDDIASKLAAMSLSTAQTLGSMAACSRQLVARMSPERFGDAFVAVIALIGGGRA